MPGSKDVSAKERSREDQAYLAGFFDGEGTVGVYLHKGRGWNLLVAVAGTNEASVRRYAPFGGHVYLAPRRPWGRRPLWSWKATGGEAKAFLAEVLPFITVKRAQVIEALKFPVHGHGEHCRDEAPERDERARIGARLRAMKKEGVYAG